MKSLYKNFIYFPLIGWIFPIIKNEKDDLLIFHLKQSFFLTLIFLFSHLFFNWAFFLIPSGFIIIKLTIFVIIYLQFGLYIFLSALSGRAASKNIKKEWPILKILANSFEL